MGDLLTPLQTTRKVKTIVEKYETPSLKDDVRHVPIVSTDTQNGDSKFTKPKKQDSTAFLQQVYLNDNAHSESLPDDAREILKSQPSQADFISVLQYLQFGIDGQHDFNIHVFGPQATRMLNILATITIPERWASLSIKHISEEDAKARKTLLSCFTCVAGLGALHARIKALSGLAKSRENASSPSLILKDTISVLEAVLQPSSFVACMLHDALTLYGKTAQRHVVWQELLSFVAGGKLLGAVAEALPLIESQNDHARSFDWLGDGNEYCKWLARNLYHAASSVTANDTESWPLLAQVLKRGLNLGYSGVLVTELSSGLLLGRKALWTPLDLLVKNLPQLEQKVFFFTLLRCLSKSHLDANLHDETISGVAAIVSGLIGDNQDLDKCMMEWLTTTTGDAVMLGMGMRRVTIAALAEHEDKLQVVLDKSMRTFSDTLHIQHDSIMQQEATAQIILIVVGILYRTNSEQISQLSRSSQYLHAVSNRLGASLPRARWLGMIVGTAISNLVDAPDKAMKFDIEEMASDEARSWLDMTKIDDRIGSIEDLKKASAPSKMLMPPSANTIPKGSRTMKARQANTTSRVISIEEVDTDEESDDDLIPYQKPDEDPSDSDEDPTLINRSKPTAPVYIIDLVRALQANDKPEIVELALKTAPELIGRKANFGSELPENIEALASALINLQEGMSGAAAQQLRLQSLIACLVAQPAKMGSWFASMYFEGDFSLTQRASVLTTVGLGSRQLAGHDDALELSTDKNASFPSRKLPAKLAAIYAPVNNLAEKFERATLQPMALAAADKMTGPDILKVRTFSSRLDVERKTAQKAKDRKTRIPKDIHKLLTESLYLPFCCRMSLLLGSHPNIDSTTLLEPHILRLFLQTLTILLNTVGPHALQLPTVTRETLILLTNLHVVTTLSTDAAVLPALLQVFLTTLDLNVAAGTIAEEKLVTDFGNMIAELVAWAANLSNVVQVPTTEKSVGMGTAWTVLAAGIQVKWHEVGRKFQGRMIGLVGSDLENF